MTAARASPVGTIGWAAYLGTSWTWCIGMFLPALLVRDFGLWAFAVFAVPNVLGAAAMGWVMKPGFSERVTAAHRPALWAFSAVTIAFQAYFAAWMTRWLAIPAWAIVPALAAASVLLASPRERAGRAAAAVVWLISVAALAVGLWQGVLDLPPTPPAPLAEQLPALAAVCVLGFGLCPYLDATFHHARQRQGAEAAVVSFGFGFAVLFTLMIVGTLLYAEPAARMIEGGLGGGRVLAAVLAVHLGVQMAFTIGAHAARWRGGAGTPEAPSAPSPHRAMMLARAGLLLAFIVGTGLGLAASAVPAGWRHAGLTAGELGYRAFLGAYGLLFPAYVWLCLWPAAGEPIAAPPRGRLALCMAVVAIAAPAFWMGFIERQTWWLVPGVGLVLAARLLLSGREATASAATDPHAVAAGK